MAGSPGAGGLAVDLSAPQRPRKAESADTRSKRLQATFKLPPDQVLRGEWGCSLELLIAGRIPGRIYLFPDYVAFKSVRVGKVCYKETFRYLDVCRIKKIFSFLVLFPCGIELTLFNGKRYAFTGFAKSGHVRVLMEALHQDAHERELALQEAAQLETQRDKDWVSSDEEDGSDEPPARPASLPSPRAPLPTVPPAPLSARGPRPAGAGGSRDVGAFIYDARPLPSPVPPPALGASAALPPSGRRLGTPERAFSTPWNTPSHPPPVPRTPRDADPDPSAHRGAAPSPRPPPALSSTRRPRSPPPRPRLRPPLAQAHAPVLALLLRLPASPLVRLRRPAQPAHPGAGPAAAGAGVGPRGAGGGRSGARGAGRPAALALAGLGRLRRVAPHGPAAVGDVSGDIVLDDHLAFATGALVAKFGNLRRLTEEHPGREVPALEFVIAVREIAKIFDKFGKALYIVKKDVVDKTDSIFAIVTQSAKRPGMLVTKHGTFALGGRPARTVQDISRVELEHKVARKEDAGAWCSVWLCRLIEFVMILLRELTRPPEPGAEPLPSEKCMAMAYKEALKPFHPWPLQKLVTPLFRFTPSRENTMRMLGLCDESGVQDIRSFMEFLEPVLTSLKTFQAHTGLADIRV
eukprot:tig00000093_g3454.t1